MQQIQKTENTNLQPDPKGSSVDEGEQFEINVLGVIKFKCKRFTAKAIIALLLVLAFIWLLVKK